MKIIYHLFTTVLFLTSCSAFAAAQEYSNNERTILEQKNFKGEVNFHGNNIITNTKSSDSKFRTRDGNYRTDVITEAPGTPQLYSKDCGGTTYSWLFGLQIYERTYPAELYWDGDNVYFPNPIFNPPYYGISYMHGTKSGDIIEVELPQTVIWYETEQYGYNLAVLKLNENPSSDGSTYAWDETITSFSYKIGKDGSLTMVMPEEFDGENLPKYVLGLIFTDADPDYDGQWIGFCDMYQTYVPFNDQQVTMPSGISPESYSLINGEYGYKVKVAFDSNDVYFQGLSEEMPEGVVKATVVSEDEDSGKMILNIAQNQYVGIYNEETFVYTKNVYINPDFDPEDENSIYILQAPEDQGYEMIFDKGNNTITPADDIYFLDFNSGKDRISYISVLEPFYMIPQDEYAGTPKNPHTLLFDDTMTDSFGFMLFYFTLPCISTTGRMLDGECLYYSVFVDDEKVEFMEDEIVALNGYESQIYWDVKEPTDILPSWFDNWWDIAKLSPTDFRIGLYMEGITTVGVQSYYIYDDVTTESALITLNIETGEISGDDTSLGSISEAEVMTVEYFDLNGRRVTNPEKGIFIKKMNLSNGKQLVKKVAR